MKMINWFFKSDEPINSITRSKECATLAYEPVKGLIISIGGYEKLTKGKICLRGGEILKEFDGSWIELSGRVSGRFNESIAVFLHNDSIYILIVGGSTESGPSPIVEVLRVGKSSVSEGSWRRMTPLPYGCHSGSLVKVLDKVYLIGGRDGANNGGRVLRHIISLSTGGLTEDTDESWVEEGILAEGRYNCGILVLNNRYIIVIGGFTGVKVLNSVEIYDTYDKICFTGPSLKYERQRSLSCIVETDIGPGIVVYGGDNPVTHRSIVNCAELWIPNQDIVSEWKDVTSICKGDSEVQITDLNLSTVSRLISKENDDGSDLLFSKNDLMAYSLVNTVDLTNTSRWNRNTSVRNSSKLNTDPFHLNKSGGESSRKTDIKSPIIVEKSSVEKKAPSIFTFSTPQWRSTKISIPFVKNSDGKDDVEVEISKVERKIFDNFTDETVSEASDVIISEVVDFNVRSESTITLSAIEDNDNSNRIIDYNYSDTISSDIEVDAKDIDVVTDNEVTESPDIITVLELQLAEIKGIRKELASIAKERYNLVINSIDRDLFFHEMGSPHSLNTPRNNNTDSSSVYKNSQDSPLCWLRSDDELLLCSPLSKLNIERHPKCQIYCLSPRADLGHRKSFLIEFCDGSIYKSMSIRGSWNKWEIDHIGHSIDHKKWIFEIDLNADDIRDDAEFKFISNGEWMTDPNLPVCINSDGILNHLLVNCIKVKRPFESPICEEGALQRGWRIDGYEHHSITSLGRC